MNFYLLLINFLTAFSVNPDTEKYLENKTVTYQEAILAYQHLDKKYPEAKLLEKGLTDAGKPLHLFLISSDKDFNISSIKKKNKRIILINNAIHPGEPDGVDACIKFSEDLLSNKINKKLLDKVVIAIIPVYNIDGALNRSCCSRVNQNGPEEYGFRGNARNLDLNRDFIKCDSENAKSFIQIFHELDPDIFVDTHTTNGADYQYVMTLISTQHNKLNYRLGEYLKNEMEPALFKMMEARKYPMSHYVDTKGKTPESGIIEFLETPRYSTGYAALNNTIGFVSESHMWKSYKERVLATYQFLDALLEYTSSNITRIGELRNIAKTETRQKTVFPLAWKLDSNHSTEIDFKGYEAEYRKSSISNLQRLYYNRDKPFLKKIKFYNNYLPSLEIGKPKFYIVPQAWKEVIERLKLNNVRFDFLNKDSLMEVEIYYITRYKTLERPFEGHYLHYDVSVRAEKQKIQYFKGDIIIATDQVSNRFIIETLEPQAGDSYFAWNFFDSILQQKEWFSDYIFEEKAEEILAGNPSLKAELNKRQVSDSSFAKNHFDQLYFIYKNSPFYEKSHLRYPVGRLN